MEPKRILFLGTTGTGKQAEMRRLINRLPARPEWHCLDFEGDFLFNQDVGGDSPADFLDNDQKSQSIAWEKAWHLFQQKLLSLGDQVMLSLHASFIRGHYGGRCFAQPDIIAREFKPDLIITCISDIYDAWERTQVKARNDALIGRPTLEQLILGRRDELLIGDLISRACGPATRNIMLSVSHPVATFTNAITHPKPTIVYLSFPISDPRELRNEGDGGAAIQMVNDFIKLAYRFQAENPNLVVQCPLTIDELPLRSIYVDSHLRDQRSVTIEEKNHEGIAIREEKCLRFLRSDRWDLKDFMNEQDEIFVPSPVGSEIVIPETQLGNAVGNIHTDVTFRDYRYVEQAHVIALFNPIIRKSRPELSRSVQNEIGHALQNKSRVFVYQDKELDDLGVVTAQFGEPGTMASSPSQQRRFRASSPQALFQQIVQISPR